MNSLPSRRFIAVLLTLAALSAHSALAGGVTGPAIVKDGDSLKINGQRIRIHGIDAPEAKQTCGRRRFRLRQ